MKRPSNTEIAGLLRNLALDSVCSQYSTHVACGDPDCTTKLARKMADILEDSDEDRSFEERIAGALGTAEQGEDLIKVAYDAHQAELENASAQRLITDLLAERCPQPHKWIEAEGEPPRDVCFHCGAERY